MKRTPIILVAILIAVNLLAQSPDKMSYQAVIRDAEGNLVISQSIGMQISILLGSADGDAVYTETHTSTTNPNGLVSIEIGAGTTTSDFSAIDWPKGPYFIKTETDPSGGDNYTITGISQLLSVPYALHAKTADSFLLTEGNLGVGTSNPSAKLHVNASEPEALRIESSQSGVTSDYYTSSGRVGYVGSLFNGNMDFGTVPDNTTGRVYLRTQGLRRLAIGAEGNIGIGTVTPASTLDLLGGQWDLDNTEGDFRIGSNNYRLKIGVATDGEDAGVSRIRAVGGSNQLRLGAGDSDVVMVDEDRIEINGALNTSTTGMTNMLPIAYGNVEGIYHNQTYNTVPIRSGTGNFSVSMGHRSSPNFYYVGGEYLITIEGIDYNHTDYVTVVSTNAGGNSDAWVWTSAKEGNLMISFIGFDSDMEKVYKMNNFHFVVYKP